METMRTPLLLLGLAAVLAVVVAIANPDVRPAVAAPAVAQSVPVSAGAASGADAGSSDSAVGELVLQRCGTCHGLQLLSQTPQTADGWQRTVALMRQMGAQLSDAEASTITQYLAAHFSAPR